MAIIVSPVPTYTYSSLQTDVASYMHRSDLTSLLPTFIRQAETFMFRELNIKDLAVSEAGVTVGEYGALPSDLATVSKVTVNYGNVEYSLDYKSNDAISTQSSPSNYAIEDNQIRIFGASTGQAYTLYYIPKIPALSTSNTSNWLLESAADLYLYATALEAARYIRDEAQVQILTGYVQPLIDSVRRLSERRGQPANASLQIKPRR